MSFTQLSTKAYYPPLARDLPPNLQLDFEQRYAWALSSVFAHPSDKTLSFQRHLSRPRSRSSIFRYHWKKLLIGAWSIRERFYSRLTQMQRRGSKRSKPINAAFFHRRFNKRAVLRVWGCHRSYLRRAKSVVDGKLIHILVRKFVNSDPGWWSRFQLLSIRTVWPQVPPP